MAETFLVLLAAHLTGDFVLQTRGMLVHKKNPAVLILHVSLVTLSSAVLLGNWYGPILGIIFITHLLMDAIKVYWLPRTAAAFLFDQAVHVLVIAILAAAYPMAFQAGAWPELLSIPHQAQFLELMTLFCGLIVGVFCGGILIDMVTKALVMLFYLIGEPSGIGFLLTAKSILRFGEIKDSSQRKVAEYIIIGTLMSFGWALLAAVLTAQAMTLWRP